ncbi:MAG: hypothetical protein FJX76_10885 [Armatimonadetes bacterium]|nr:hypothetical protein [Armatimonadota bacterium]
MNVLSTSAMRGPVLSGPFTPAEETTPAPTDEVILGGTPDPGLIPRPANAARANGTASGWVGRNSLYVSLDQNGDSADVNGTVGGAFVNLTQRQNGSFGRISGMVGHTFVNLNVARYDSGNGHRDSTVSGFVNGQYLNIRESGDARSSWITGQVGGRSLNIHRSGSPSNSWYSGFVSGVPNGNVSVTVNMSGEQTPAEVFLPLLAAAN